MLSYESKICFVSNLRSVKTYLTDNQTTQSRQFLGEMDKAKGFGINSPELTQSRDYVVYGELQSTVKQFGNCYNCCECKYN